MAICGICKRRIWFWEASKIYEIAPKRDPDITFYVECHKDCWEELCYLSLLEEKSKNSKRDG